MLKTLDGGSIYQIEKQKEDMEGKQKREGWTKKTGCRRKNNEILQKPRQHWWFKLMEILMKGFYTEPGVGRTKY